MTVVPCAAISRNREVPKSATFAMPVSVTMHVAGPQVAVDDALAVGVVHGVADLAGVVEGPRQVERALAIGDRLERLARHVLHHDEEHVVVALGGEHRDDVRMAERRQQPRLAQQLAEVQVLPVRNLERDLLVDPGVFGEVDGAEPAAAERREDAVLADPWSRKNIRPKYRRTVPQARAASGVDAIIRRVLPRFSRARAAVGDGGRSRSRPTRRRISRACCVSGAGDAMRVFDGRGREWDARDRDVRGAVTLVDGSARVDPAPRDRACATRSRWRCSRATTWTRSMRDAVMLGAAAIRPLVAARRR